MEQVLRTFEDPIVSRDGVRFFARACGRQVDNHWEGWLEFESQGEDAVLRSERETTQPNLTAAEYWASGLSEVYLEGALERALEPVATAPPPPLSSPAFSAPAPPRRPVVPARPILDPFSVYAKGETLLRGELGALDGRHLRAIARGYRLVDERRVDLELLREPELVELIVTGVRDAAPLGG
ncbi:MAG TPA: hypothetical protein VF121_11175 [Thermoanaerobaculia bacterium]|nr:hypothetical protein [Thermoanaerobaculia bacterium]